MTLFCRLCADEEGFFVKGTVPSRNNNPMDLRHSPHSAHAAGNPEGIGIIDSVADGWADAERQARLWADRGLTLQQAVEDFLAPPSENNSDAYLKFVIDGFGGRVNAATPMSEVLEIQA